METTQEVEAQNLREVDKITSITGDKYAPAAEIARLDMSDRANGWVWVDIRWYDSDIRGHFTRAYRLGIYESVTVL